MGEYPRYWNETIETMDLEEIERMQEEKLRKQIEYVHENSPFYRKIFKEAGLRPMHIKTIEDLENIPLVVKDDLRRSQENYPPFGDYLTARREDIVRIHASSGTTGRPTYQACTREEIATWTEGLSRLYWAMGFRPGDVFMYGLAYGWVMPTTVMQDVMLHMGITFIPAGTISSERFISASNELGATVSFMTPSYALYLAEVIKNRFGLDPKEVGRYRIFCCGAEPGLTTFREEIEQAWGVKAYNGCGNSDVYPAILGECEMQDGMHIQMHDYVIVQLVNPDTGKNIPMEEGAEGAICYTNIAPKAQPLIRFNCNDKMRILKKDKCPCGRPGIKVDVIDRYDNMLIVKGLNVFPSAVQDVIAKFKPRVTGAMQILKKEPGPRIEGIPQIEVEYSKDIAEDKIKDLKEEIEQRIYSLLMFKSEVIMKPEGTLPRFQFKAQLVRKLY